ncbi:unnamed protein product [Rhodiola kirilowii]
MEFGDQHRRDENEEVEEQQQEMLVNNDNVNNNLIIAAPAIPPRPLYRDCMKNHAINMVVHAVDGCGEFMPGGPEGSIEALRCAACTCHRNFHRKVEPGDVYPPPAAPLVVYHRPPPPAPYNAQTQPLALPSPGVAGGSLSKDDDHVEVENPNGGEMVADASGTKKRFRTKFTQEQKDKMLAMAQRIGWRLKRTDEELVQQFCNESGVKRSVFKVWMHNHRFNLGGSNGNNNSISQQQPQN